VGGPMSAGRAEEPGKSQAAGQPEYGVPRGEDERLVELPEGAVSHEESNAAEEQVERLPRRRRPPRAPPAQVACNHDSPRTRARAHARMMASPSYRRQGAPRPRPGAERWPVRAKSKCACMR